MRPRGLVACSFAILGGIGALGSACARPNTARSPTNAAPPAVVALIVVDQLGAWVAAERFPTLPADGGFARLLREGTYAREMRYAHAVTDTGPGHASLHTGATPRVHGIYANEHVEGGRRVSILRDPDAHVVTAEGVSDIGASAKALHAETIADRFHAAYPGSAILSVSLKDRSAIFGGGHSATASVWFDSKRDRFVTSSAFAQAMPAWAALHASPDVLAAARARPWTPLDEPRLQGHAATPDDAPGEGDIGGFGVTFPHYASRTKQPAIAFRALPASDDVLVDLALAGLDAERARPQPTLLSISFSANDYIGHAFGPDSWEAWDELRRLDATIATLLRGLDARFGRDGYAVVLSADHGIVTMPEAATFPKARPWCLPHAPADRWQRGCGKGGRLNPDALAEALSRTADAAIGDRSVIAGVADPYVVLAPPAAALDAEKRVRLIDALTRALLAMPEVDRVYDVGAIPAVCPPVADESIDALVCRSVSSEAPRGLYVLPKRESFFETDYTPGHGTSHGTPYLYDRAVPLLVRAPGRLAAGRVIDAPIGFASYARTACALLGIAAPPSSEPGTDLTRDSGAPKK